MRWPPIRPGATEPVACSRCDHFTTDDTATPNRAAAQPVAVSVDVGGFLGLGEKDVVIGLDQVAKDGDKLKVSMTKEQIEALPPFED